jgi:hypothetical protein
MTGTADEGFGALPFGAIARATVAAQERSLELAQAMLAPLGAAQPEAFGNLVQSWNDAFLRLLEAAPGAQPRRPARGD